jgi:hypothetical protein
VAAPHRPARRPVVGADQSPSGRGRVSRRHLTFASPFASSR